MITWEHEIQAQGDGYNGRYRFMGTRDGWVLKGGPAFDYLTPGIGYPLHAATPEQLLHMIRTNRPKVKITVIEPVSREYKS